MTDRIPVIVGYDAVSPLGTEMVSQWERAAEGKSGIGQLTRFPINEDFPVDIAGQVDEIDVNGYPFLSPRKLALWPSPVFKYALLVVHRALKKSGIEVTPDLSPRVAVTFSSAVGGQDALLDAHRQMVAKGKLPPPYANPNSCVNMVGGKISILTGATGPITSAISACATGVTSLIVGALLLEQGRADVVICGAVDFPLVAPIVAGFATMNGAYQRRPGEIRASAAEASRPFSIDRHGFVVSEGAGCIILASREFAVAHGLDTRIELAGWAMTSDAHHYVAPHLATVARCMAEAISDAGISARDVRAVNAHATSTLIGDRVEAEALKTVFGRLVPPVTANKSIIGHAMGASSAIESIFSVEGMLRDRLLPTINYLPDPELMLGCITDKVCHVQQDFVLKNAFGFGGCNACIVLKKTA